MTIGPQALIDTVAGILRFDLGAKMLVAVLAGGAIGMERQSSGKAAGLRTNILICVGSALLMDLSMNIGVAFGETRIGDPARLAAQAVTGIGFIGAGTIMQSRGTITGLTSAATIWVVAAIGLTAGAGFYVEALGTTLTVMVVLAAEGLAIVSVKTYDHPTDRVFELRARGPSRQFDIARSELGSRPEVLNVLFD